MLATGACAWYSLEIALLPEGWMWGKLIGRLYDSHLWGMAIPWGKRMTLDKLETVACLLGKMNTAGF